MAFWNSRAGTRLAALGSAFVLALAVSGAVPARAQHIEIGPDALSYKTTITIKNGTDSPVTFNRASNTCVPDAPESITLAANESKTFSVTQKHSDDGLDNCYLAHHSITYQDAADIGNTFGVQQYGNSSDPACLDINIFVVFYIGQAICPVASGSVSGPTSWIYFNPGSQDPHVGTTCPGDISYCRGYGANREMFFGFYVSKPAAFAVSVVNADPAIAIDCVLTDLANAKDANACVSVSATVAIGAEGQLSLAGYCNKFYRTQDRTNVQLECTAPFHVTSGGAGSSLTVPWPNVTNGGTYTFSGS